MTDPADPPDSVDPLLDDAPSVVTGQQAGLLGGPLFTLGKLLGAVALARVRGARPVFWIECDDADIREVDRVTLLDPSGEPRTLSLGEPDDGRPVAARRLDDRVDKLLAEVEGLLGAGANAAAAMADLRRSYRPGVAWAAAFQGYLGTLVEGLGVGFLDPSAASFKVAAQALFARVIEQAEAVEQALGAGASGVKDPQVPHLPGELPLFVLDGEGRRRKLVRTGSAGFALKGDSAAELSGKGLLDLLAAEPHRFSAGVLLRPVLQDALLRTVAYVAGPAEARYHEQLEPLYRTLDVARPEVIGRPRLVLLEPRARRGIARLGVSLDDALAGEAALRERAAREQSGIDPRAAAEATLARLRQELQPLRERLLPLDPGQLSKPFDEAEAGIAYHVQKLGARAAAALERKDQDVVLAARKVARLLVPDGVPQERVYPVAPFLARTSRASLVATILAAIDPADLGRRLVIDL